MADLTHVDIRMYRIGTGDCFVLKFFADETEKLKMMIDAGVWQGSKARLTPFVEDLKSYVDNHIHLLVVTHEHTDHVLAFDRCRDLFTNDFQVDHIWMGWTENDEEEKVKEWKKKYGEKKMALALVANKLKDSIDAEDFQNQLKGAKFGEQILGARKLFSKGVDEFADLHVNVKPSTIFSAKSKTYKGGLRGMRIVKEDIADNNIRYCNPGEIIENVEHAEGIRFYVLGPPELHEVVKKESGKNGESYDHNKDLEEDNAFVNALLVEDGEDVPYALYPFDEKYCITEGSYSEVQKRYGEKDKEWRKIDYDWLYSAGSLALRMNSLTNNLSLVLAIEFEGTGQILLFPGDAEYGSWESWHQIEWNQTNDCDSNNTLTTEDLLNRTVFYKVAHHLSHNGTARRLGMEMLTHRDLAAMATLDYDVISKGWKSTMPNRAIIDELLTRTKGKLMLMNEEDLEHGSLSMTEALAEARKKMTNQEAAKFEDNFQQEEFYLQYTVEVK